MVFFLQFPLNFFRCAYGHRFFELYIDKKDYCPIITEWVDLIWQCMQQFPESFEYNENFLIKFLDELQAGMFGEFLSNSERDRSDQLIQFRANSFWGYVASNLACFKNLSFKSCNGALIPVSNFKTVRFWYGYYARQSGREKARKILRE